MVDLPLLPLQLVATLMITYASYQPLNSLLTALEVRGSGMVAVCCGRW